MRTPPGDPTSKVDLVSCENACHHANMPKTVQIREIPDETYRKLAERAAKANITVPDYLRRLAERDVARPSVAEWVERTRQRGGPVRQSDAVADFDEIRGPWPSDDDR